MKLALAGDTMLGRKVAEAIAVTGPEYLFAEEVVALTRSADLFVLNLECCISEDGRPWADPRKPFFFRAPPAATEVLNRLGVDCVTLANNHALDFGPQALLDTFDHLREAGIACVGAGRRLTEARAPAVLEAQASALPCSVAATIRPISQRPPCLPGSPTSICKAGWTGCRRRSRSSTSMPCS